MYAGSWKDMELLDDEAVGSGLEIRQMMELAGWQMVPFLARLALEGPVVFLCGKGNKGGDGLSAARHLANYGYDVSVVLAGNELKPDPAHHLALVEKMRIPVARYADEPEAALALMRSAKVAVDALIGYHLSGAPQGAFAELIRRFNALPAYKIAYDLPSGADPDTGDGAGERVTADATLSLAMPKKLFFTEEGKRHSGRVFVADIGIPAFLYEKVRPGSRPAFDDSGLLELKAPLKA